MGFEQKATTGAPLPSFAPAARENEAHEYASAGIIRAKAENRNTQAGQYTEEQLERAREIAAQALAWMADNPAAMAYAERIALHEAEAGRRVSGSAIVEEIRKKDFTDVCGKPTRVNNNHAPIIARRLCAIHPEIAEHVETRTDVYEVAGV